MIRQEIINALRQRDDALAVINSEIWYERTADCLLRSDSKINADLIKENEELKEQLGTRINKIVTAKNGLTKEVFIAKRSPLSYDIVLKDWNYRYTNEDESVEYDFRYCHEDKEHKSWEQAEQRLKELHK